MGYIKCKECGTEYDSDYSSCPNCGCNRGMDKPLKMLITAISVMLIIGAGAVFIIHSNHAKRVEMEVEILAMEQEAIEKKIASIKDAEENELQRIESEREERERRTAREDAEKKRYADAEIARQYEEYQAEQQRMQQEAEMARQQQEYERQQQRNSNQRSSKSMPHIYSADSFLNAVFCARIYNEEGARVYFRQNGLWIGETMVTGFAPRVTDFNEVGGIIVYNTPESVKLTFMVDFSQSMIIFNVQGRNNNHFMYIK